jgi:hypothetical protein
LDLFWKQVFSYSKVNEKTHKTDHLDECMDQQAAYNCAVEAQVMHVLFSLLHACYEDYSA